MPATNEPMHATANAAISMFREFMGASTTVVDSSPSSASGVSKWPLRQVDRRDISGHPWQQRYALRSHAAHEPSTLRHGADRQTSQYQDDSGDALEASRWSGIVLVPIAVSRILLSQVAAEDETDQGDQTSSQNTNRNLALLRQGSVSGQAFAASRALATPMARAGARALRTRNVPLRPYRNSESRDTQADASLGEPRAELNPAISHRATDLSSM